MSDIVFHHDDFGSMHIDLVITELFVGGAERCLTELAIGLQEAGDQVRVFSLGRLPSGEQALLVDRLREAGIGVASGGADNVWNMPRCHRQLRTWFRQQPADICQTFLFHANVLGTAAARAEQRPVCVGGLRVAETKPVRCWLERRAVRRMDRLVCVSSAVKRFAMQQLRCGASTAVVIPNGVEVSQFASARPVSWSDYGWPDDSVVSLFVGRLHPQKGIDLLQQEIDHLAPAGSSQRVLLVGDGPLGHSLRAWAEQIGKDRVQILPWQTNVAPLMAAARLLILPSRYEGMPNVVLEAMAAGRPVVCSRVEGSEELLAGDDSQGFASGDHRAMAQLAVRFLQDPEISEATGQRNQQRVRRDFSLPAMVDAYRSHYRTLLSRRFET